MSAGDILRWASDNWGTLAGLGSGVILGRFARFQAVSLRSTVHHSYLSYPCYLVTVRVRIENIGRVRVRIPYSYGIINQILPCKIDSMLAIREKRDKDMHGDILWDGLDRVEIETMVDLEPHENSVQQFDFTVDCSVEKIAIYIFFQKGKKRGPGLAAKHGWVVRADYDLTKGQLEE